MAKNMTRKGLAIGASAALAAAGFVGISSPAMADSNIYLVPNVGGAEQNRVPIEEDFTLKTYYGVNANGLLAPVSVLINDDGGNLSSIELTDNGGGTASSPADRTQTLTAASDYDSDDKTFSAELIRTSAGIGAAETIKLVPKAVTTDSETFSVIVTTWFDDGDGVPEAGETQASQEVHFHVSDDYDWVIDFTKPELADTFFEATVSTTVPSINLAMFAENWGMAFGTVAGSDLTTATDDSDESGTSDRFGGGTAASDASTEYDAEGAGSEANADFVDFQADGTVEFKVEASTAVGAGSYVAAVVFDGTPSNPTAADASLNGATEVKRVAALVAATELDSDGVRDPELVVTEDTFGSNIRTGTNSVTFEAELFENYAGVADPANKAIGAGVVATVTINKGTTFDEDSALSAGGETLTDETDPAEISFDVTTDADGKISFDVDTSSLVKTDEFTIDVIAEGVANAGGTTGPFVITDTAPATFVEHNLLGNGAQWKVEDGTYTLLFAAVDNFNQPLVGSDYQVVLSNGNTPAGDGDVQVAPLANGVASFTVSTEDSDGDDVSAFTAQLRELDGIDYDVADLGSGTDNATATVNVADLGASNPAAELTVKATKPGGSEETAEESTDFQLPQSVSSNADSFDLTLEDFADANMRLGETNDVIDNGGNAVTLTGDIVDATGISTYGNVTISGEGLLFKAAGPTSPDGSTGKQLDVYETDSITVQTSLLGAYSVDVFSNTAGKVDVTVSSGNASQVVTLVFDSAADNTGADLTIDAPNSVAPGSTLEYVATLVDKYGNPVIGGTTPTVSGARFNYDGPGFVVGDLPTAFGADGTATVTIFLGNNDGGKTGTLTVSYSPTNLTDPAGVLAYDYDGDNDLVVQKSVNIGNVPTPASEAGEFKPWTKLNDAVDNVKFYAKNPIDAGKIQFFFNGDEIAWHRSTSATSFEGGEARYNTDQDAYYLVRDVDLVSGIKNVFEIYQDGERVWRAVKSID